MSQRANIVIDQGTTFSTQINLNDSTGAPIDMSAYTIDAQFRKDYTSVTKYNFDTIGNAYGQIGLSLSANASANIAAGRDFDDVRVTDGAGLVSRIMEGQVTIRPWISR